MLKRFFERANKFIESNKYSGVAVALVIYLLVVLSCFTNVYEIFELKLYDLRFMVRPSIKEWDHLYFLDIDEISLTTVGQFPWPRNKYAEGIKTLKEVNATQVSFDVMFPDASPRNLDGKDLATLMKKAGKGGRVSIVDVEMTGNKDKIFSDSVAAIDRVVLSYTFNDEPLAYDVLERQKKASFKKALPRFLERSSIKVSPAQLKKLGSLLDPAVKSISFPIPELMNSGHAFGFVNRDTDIDGFLRKVRLVRLYKGRLYFNLAMMMFLDICDVPLDRVEVIPGSRIILKKAVDPITKKTRDIAIPIDSKGMVYVTWAGSGEGKGGIREKTFHLVPFFALLEYGEIKDLAWKEFNDKDDLKKDELAKRGQLVAQLAELSEDIKGADSETKKILAANMKELKKNIRQISVNLPLDELTMRMNAARKEYVASQDESLRQKKWDEIVKLKKSINRTKLEYQALYKKEIKDLNKKIKNNNDPKLRDDLNREIYIEGALDLVTRVEDLADRIVLVGLTATGSQDIGAMPLTKEYARVGTYHNTINTFIQRDFIKKVNWPVNFLIMLLLSIVMGYTIQRLDARRSLIAMTASFIALNIVVMAFFALMNIWLQQLGMVLSMFVPSIAIVGIKLLKEESQKRFIKSAFSYYLSPRVIEKIIENPDSLKLGGEDREITIFFSDVKSFSSISEKLTAQDLVKRLNEYLTEMTDIILRNEGTVDKYIGDAIMAFYGAPISMPDHPQKACMAAIEMRKRLRELQEKWKMAGQDPLEARMGIHTGKSTVGNMGSTTRMDYTAMGDPVNLASRLEGLNKYYDTHAMISGTTYESVQNDIEGRQLDIVRVVGKAEAVPVYELLGKKGTLPDRMYEMLDVYNQGREHFLGRDWKQARALFVRALKVIPDDGPSKIFIKRCDEFIKDPPSRKWDGVYVLKGK